jgi:hypothetical protein
MPIKTPFFRPSMPIKQFANATASPARHLTSSARISPTRLIWRTSSIA